MTDVRAEAAIAPFWVATMAESERHVSVATGVLNTGGNLPGIVGGVLVPVTANLLGEPAAMVTGSVFAIVGALLWIFIRADVPMGAGVVPPKMYPVSRKVCYGSARVSPRISSM